MRWRERLQTRRAVSAQKSYLKAGPGRRERVSAWLARRARRQPSGRGPLFRSRADRFAGTAVLGLVLAAGLGWWISRTPVGVGGAATPIVSPGPSQAPVMISPAAIPYPSPDPGPQTNRAPAGH
ncbi:MAG: hypothetical protein LC722_00300 [Actinobacteria bacterium]|nr:hypothetical protein [Actinomycetota bacterium]